MSHTLEVPMPHSYEARIVSGQLLWLNDTPPTGDARVVVTFLDDAPSTMPHLETDNTTPQSEMLVAPTPGPQLRKIRNRHWLQVNGVELEVCEDEQGLFFVRHHIYWAFVHRNSTPHPVFNAVLQTLADTVNCDMPASRWREFPFQFEAILLAQEGITLDVVMLPLELFEDLIRWSASHYKGTPAVDAPNVLLSHWLQSYRLKDLLTGSCIFPGRKPLPTSLSLPPDVPHPSFKLSGHELTRFPACPLELKARLP